MIYLVLIILGAVQGATEFLPVSSSGHLALSRFIMNKGTPLEMLIQAPLALDILLHLATLAAVMLFFRKRLVDAILGAGRLLKSATSGAVKSQLADDDGANLAVCVLLGTIPTAALGMLLKDTAQQISSTPWMLGTTFFACAGLLMLSKFWPGGQQRLSIRLALVIGLFQGIAVLPGLSRSGTTIAVALALGLRRDEAATFSFLLSLPAILGAALLEIDMDSLLFDGPIAAFAVGAVAAFLIGLLALHFLVSLVKKGRIWLFAPYLMLTGIYCLAFV